MIELTSSISAVHTTELKKNYNTAYGKSRVFTGQTAAGGGRKDIIPENQSGLRPAS